MSAQFSAQIARGVQLLNATLGPPWVQRVDVRRLDMETMDECVLGQLNAWRFGNVDNNAVACGFFRPDGTQDRKAFYAQLTREWCAVIAQGQGYRGPR